MSKEYSGLCVLLSLIGLVAYHYGTISPLILKTVEQENKIKELNLVIKEQVTTKSYNLAASLARTVGYDETKEIFLIPELEKFCHFLATRIANQMIIDENMRGDILIKNINWLDLKSTEEKLLLLNASHTNSDPAVQQAREGADPAGQLLMIQDEENYWHVFEYWRNNSNAKDAFISYFSKALYASMSRSENINHQFAAQLIKETVLPKLKQLGKDLFTKADDFNILRDFFYQCKKNNLNRIFVKPKIGYIIFSGKMDSGSRGKAMNFTVPIDRPHAISKFEIILP